MKTKKVFSFTAMGYDCEATFLSEGPEYTKVRLVKEHIILFVSACIEFKENGYSPMEIGIKVKSTSSYDPVQGQKIAPNLLQIGCVEIQETEFNKLLNLIRFKQNEFIRSISA